MSFEVPNSENRQAAPSGDFYASQELFAPPKLEDMILPDGYVYPADRVYPLAPQTSQSVITVFNEHKGNFIGAFQPNRIVSDIKYRQARRIGKKLRKNGYTMIMSAQINKLDDTRTVAEVMSMDFDCPNPLIIRYLKEGAMVAPCMIFESPGRKPHYSAGVGLWMTSEQFDGLSK